MDKESMISSLDLYGVEPRLNLNGRETQGSLLGLISTFISATLMAASTIYFSLGMFDENNVAILTSSIKTDELLNVTLDKNTFFFTTGLEDPNTYNTFIDEGIYIPEAYYKAAKRNDKGGLDWYVEKLNLTKCSKEYFGDEYKDKVDNSPVDTLYCIPNINVSIFGTYLLETYSMIFITIAECKNTTEKSNCKSQEEINYYLDGTFVTVGYQDYTFDPKIHKKPNKPVMKNYYTTISHNFFKELQVFFKVISIKTDNGFLFESIETKNFTQYDRTLDLLSFKKGEYISEISIKLSDYVDEMNRSYEKVQSVIANIGGIIKFIHTFFFLANLLFNQTTLNTILIKQLFFLKSHEKESTISTSTIYNSQSNHFIQSHKFCLASRCSSKKQIQSPIKENINIKIKQSHKLQMNCMKGLAICLKKKHKDNDILYYIKGTNLINQKLNIASIISESYCNELMHLFVLNDDQQKLFQFCSKPEISLQTNKFEHQNIKSLRTFHYYQKNSKIKVPQDKDKDLEIVNAYANLKSKNPNMIDNILIKRSEQFFS